MDGVESLSRMRLERQMQKLLLQHQPSGAREADEEKPPAEDEELLAATDSKIAKEPNWEVLLADAVSSLLLAGANLGRSFPFSFSQRERISKGLDISEFKKTSAADSTDNSDEEWVLNVSSTLAPPAVLEQASRVGLRMLYRIF
jgi:hypothetical protein